MNPWYLLSMIWYHQIIATLFCHGGEPFERITRNSRHKKVR